MSFLGIDGPGFPGGLIIYHGHLFPPKGHLCRQPEGLTMATILCIIFATFSASHLLCGLRDPESSHHVPFTGVFPAPNGLLYPPFDLFAFVSKREVWLHQHTAPPAPVVLGSGGVKKHGASGVGRFSARADS